MQIMELHDPIPIMSREMSPQWSPSNLCTRECFALLFGVEVFPTVEDGARLHILPANAWMEHIIFDILSPTIEDISQVVILNPMECLIFWGCHSKGEGFTYGKALALSDTYHHETTTWIGHRVKMHCVICTFWDTRGDLCMVRDQERDKTLECIWQQYQSNHENDPFAPTWGRGYTHHADCYYAQRFLWKEWDHKPGGCQDEVRDCHSQSREQSHKRWHIHHSGERLQSLYDHHVTPWKSPLWASVRWRPSQESTAGILWCIPLSKRGAVRYGTEFWKRQWGRVRWHRRLWHWNVQIHHGGWSRLPHSVWPQKNQQAQTSRMMSGIWQDQTA